MNPAAPLASDPARRADHLDAAVSADRLAAARHAENFPVALRILPRSRRRDLEAVYDVVRVIDDLGDEADGDRSALLTCVAADLDRVWSGSPRARVLRELRAAPGFARLESEPFRRLVRANLADQTVTSYPTFADLVGYCRLSADPIGRLVLAVFDASTPERVRWSDSICTALQILEHCQDVAEDRARGRGRVYLPVEDLARFAVPETDLDAAATSPALRRLIGFEVDRAAGLLDAGLPLVRSLSGWARVAVAGFAAGGLATADALRAADFDVLTVTPAPTRARTARHAVALLRGSR